MAECGERDDPGLPTLSYAVVEHDGPDLTDATLKGAAIVRVIPFRRCRHIGHLRMGVLASHQGQGIGRSLLEGAAAQGRHIGLTKIELTVLERNEIARRLYRSFGFEEEGRRRRAMIIDGVAADEFYMGLLL